MIDSGASYNFIFNKLVKKLNLCITPTKNFGVTIEDEFQIKGIGACQHVNLKIQGVKIKQNFLSIKLGNMDMIMGIEWLSQLGDVKTNWMLLVLKFKENGKWVDIQGDPSLSKIEVSLKKTC